MKKNPLVKTSAPKATQLTEPNPPSEKLLNYLNKQIAAVNPLKLDKEPLDELLQSYQPKDAIEAMLLTQMGFVHNLCMVVTLRAGIEAKSGATPVLQKSASVAKLLNLFTRQMEALSHYRGKSSTQKIVVEQVKVENGGQAIVGNVNKGG